MIINFSKKVCKKGLLALFFALPLLTSAQQDSLTSNSKIAVGVSRNAYRGDLGDPYDKWTAAFHVSFLFNYQRRLHGGLHTGLGTITGQMIPSNTFDPTNIPAFNEFFRSNFISIHYALQYDIIRTERLIVYLSQGLGLLRFMPKDQFYKNLQDQPGTRASNEAYGNVAAVLPTQLGIDYYFTNRFGIGIKAGWLNTTTDYLDNVSLLGQRQGNDNILQYQFLFYIPARF